MDMTQPLSQTWNLDVFFPGGSNSPALAELLAELEPAIQAFRGQVAAVPVTAGTAEAEAWHAMLATGQDLVKRLRQAGAFVSCLTAQNVHDQQARLLEGQIRQLSSDYTRALTLLDERVLLIPDDAWEALLAHELLQPVSFPLQERRQRAREKLPPVQEALVTMLSVDGYHGWSELYNTVVGRMTIPFTEDGETVRLSVGQAANKLEDADRSVRSRALTAWEAAWAAEADLCAGILNHLSGYRLNLYRARGWESVLEEPLHHGRMSAQTLDAMWHVVCRSKARVVAFLQRKARLLGVPALSWHDTSAPAAQSGTRISYADAADFIVEQFRQFSPQMADFARMSFTDRWIEAENRPGKRPGGFCTSFPLSHQSRIFMTFDGLPGNVTTLAHELGHAYHQHVMNDLPHMVQFYPMNLAETASTFAEAIVANAALKQSTNRAERLALLEEKAQRCVSFLMNIHARFLFETSFYAERRRGPLSVEQLNHLMVEAQKSAFANTLDTYHPHFWASKLHFYITGVPFYNFPYTFGYLFSSGVYARALAEGPGFAQKYVDLLRDTGRMAVEDLAARHLGVDLTRPDFWQEAADVVLADIDEYLRLTE